MNETTSLTNYLVRDVVCVFIDLNLLVVAR
ncbi:Uncharacterised protein [Mycobacteroides abscessus]|nr:Uncharacterised protein [Mycobacteroides abscessus]